MSIPQNPSSSLLNNPSTGAETPPDEGFVLLPYQQRWLADDAPVKVYEKSRRIGISWAEACDAVLYAAAKTGDDVWYIGYNREMAQEFIGDCADWARKLGRAASAIEADILKDEDRDISIFRIRMASGHKISALSSRPSNLRGKQGRVVIDEAAFHDDLDGLMKAAMALLMWGGAVRIISTHFGDDNPFNSLIQDIRAGRRPYSLHRTTLDDALADGLYRRICLTTGKEWSSEAEARWRQELIDFYGDAADEELFCIPSSSSDRYLTRSMVEGCMSDDSEVLRWRPPALDFVDWPKDMRYREMQDWLNRYVQPVLDSLNKDLRHFCGEDFARSGDLTVIWILARNQDLSWSTPLVIELRDCPFQTQKQVLFYVLSRLPRFSGASLDARGNGQYLAEVARQRFGSHLINEVMLSDAWYREHMPRYQAAFEDKTITIPKDADILDDMMSVRLIKGVAKVADRASGRGDDRGMRHGDSAIALALAIHASASAAGGWDWQPVTTTYRASRITRGY